jgi:small GTP-binding protein
MTYLYDFKGLMVGDSGTGKTAMLKMLKHNTFSTDFQSTIGVDVVFKLIKLMEEGPTVQIRMFDMTGQKNFQPIVKSYYRHMAFIIIVFDVSRRESFTNVSFWNVKIKKNNNDQKTVSTLVLVGNKIDTDRREVSSVEAEEFASAIGATYYETSSKTNLGITPMFDDIAKRVYQRIPTVPESAWKQSGISRGEQTDQVDTEITVSKPSSKFTRRCLIT